MRSKITLTILAAGLFGVGAGIGLLAMPTDASAQSAKKGCWYQPPNPPACDMCGLSCGSGQECCTIVVE